MELHIANNPQQLSENLAAFLTQYIQETLQQKEIFTFVLSGGNTPKSLYALLAKEPYVNMIEWNRVHFFWGDERAVPFEDPRNNARMAYDVLLDKVGALPENIHVMRTDIEPEASAKEYENILHKYFKGKENTFDLVLLGMGDDGHTLSLFPGLPIVQEKKAWAKAFWLEAQDMYRITLTAPVTNLASCVVFMATGEGKALTLKAVLDGNPDPDTYPSQLIRPENGQLHWFVDEAAAGALQI
ncbi:6-phosphogluconolactonase [Chitinophaga sp.]|uniref:6-phosphogluconolactonase n=1 Tax=Chitinophaga sp. TaxID=1869181 RepID=UPI00260B3756|nr:6-phosphogluconolactonase [uncultured Chitinophaga sp.]